MGRSQYQSEKRRKELARLKKQEEKRQRRFNKKPEGEKGPEQPGDVPADGVQGEQAGMDQASSAAPEAVTDPGSPQEGGQTGQA